jgi:hypothetical protein
VEVIGNNPANGTIKHYRGIYNLWSNGVSTLIATSELSD